MSLPRRRCVVKKPDREFPIKQQLTQVAVHRRSSAATTAYYLHSKIYFASVLKTHSQLKSFTMILDEKNMQTPPPPYLSTVAGPPPFHHRIGPAPNLHTLPSHILLQIVYSTFPQTSLLDQAKIERQRKTLYWLAISLRLVNRALYIACTHILRSTYLPSYDSLIRPPYTSDPFPLLSTNSQPSHSPSSPYGPSPSSSSSNSQSQSPLQTIQRETTTLDLFIALKVREDVWADDSELHLERDESFKDLFDLVQPRSRLEDLIRTYGIREGVITLKPPRSSRSNNNLLAAASRSTPALRPSPPPASPTPPSPSSSGFLSIFSSSFSKSKARQPIPYTQPPPRLNLRSSQQPQQQQQQITPIPFNLISISFSPRKVGVVLLPNKRTIVETSRTKEEKLEAAAKRLVKELKVWLAESG